MKIFHFITKLTLVFAHSSIYRVGHIKCYRAITLRLLIISKNVSDKIFSVREGHHTGTPYFFYRWRRWSYVKVNSAFLNGTMYFFSMTLLPILRRIHRPTRQGHSSHAKCENSRKIEKYRNIHFQRIH